MFRGTRRRYGHWAGRLSRRVGPAYRSIMDKQDERARRLAEALRQNLRRRKAQGRDIADTATSASRPEPIERA